MAKYALKVSIILLAQNPVATCFMSIYARSFRDCSIEPVMLTEEKVTMVVQVNGKLRGNITVKRGLAEDEVTDAAQEIVLKWLEGKEIVKVIVVADKLVNFVIK